MLESIELGHSVACWEKDKGEKSSMTANDEVILKVQKLKKYFPIRRGVFRRQVGDVKAVDDVSFEVYRGETLGSGRGERLR